MHDAAVRCVAALDKRERGGWPGSPMWQRIVITTRLLRDF